MICKMVFVKRESSNVNLRAFNFEIAIITLNLKLSTCFNTGKPLKFSRFRTNNLRLKFISNIASEIHPFKIYIA